MASKRRAPAGGDPEATRRTILKEAERIFDTHGLRRTTMDDVASAAGVSRMTLYRYFSDRDALIAAIVSKRSTALVGKVHAVIAEHGNLNDKLIEGLLYLAERGRQDHFIGLLLRSETFDFTNKVLFDQNSVSVAFAEAVWGPSLEEAVRRGELPADFSSESAYVWLTSVNFMMIAWLDKPEADISFYRNLLQRYVIPAFSASANVASTPRA